MPCRPRRLFRLLLFSLFLPVAAVGLNHCLAQTPAPSTRSPAALYLVNTDANDLTLSTPAQGTVCTKPNLVIITHGWYEREPWPEWMALALAGKVERRKWRCGWCDWRGQANRLRPSMAATIGRDTVGPQLGRQIVRLSRNWRHVHFVGHSAGSWVINAAAEIVARETEADIHITFLDAYVPDGWDESVLGQLANRSRENCWIEHYFTRDLLNLTENELPYAHNVDITAVNPGFKGHKFPWHWYLATIAGTYTTDARLADKPVLCRTDGLTYGFSRARENGPSFWAESLMLGPGDDPVRIRPPGDSPRVPRR
jgi:hypothetical protein